MKSKYCFSKNRYCYFFVFSLSRFLSLIAAVGQRVQGGGNSDCFQSDCINNVIKAKLHKERADSSESLVKELQSKFENVMLVLETVLFFGCLMSVGTGKDEGGEPGS